MLIHFGSSWLFMLLLCFNFPSHPQPYCMGDYAVASCYLYFFFSCWPPRSANFVSKNCCDWLAIFPFDVEDIQLPFPGFASSFNQFLILLAGISKSHVFQSDGWNVTIRLLDETEGHNICPWLSWIGCFEGSRKNGEKWCIKPCDVSSSIFGEFHVCHFASFTCVGVFRILYIE